VRRSCAVVSLLCAWVLWESKEYLSPGHGSREEWTIMRSYEALAACKTDQAQLLTGTTGWVLQKEKTRTENGFWATIRDDAGKAAQNIRYRALCVPGTLDPRPRQ